MALPEAKADFSLKETKPIIGGGRVSGSQKLTSSHDLIEQTHYLYVKVVKARGLPSYNAPFVEITIGNYKGTTKYLDKKPNPEPEWNHVFAFRKERIQTASVQINVREKDSDQFIGKIAFIVSKIPTRVPPDSPLAPQWYQLQDNDGVTVGSAELMLVIWFGTQADEVHNEASRSDAPNVTCSKVYLSPKLWYLRVNIIEGQDLVPRDRTRMPEVYVKATLGNVSLKTKVSADKSVNPKWNEDLMFVVAEPLDTHDPLVLTVEDKLGNNMEEILGRLVIPLNEVKIRWLPEPAAAKWEDLKNVSMEEAGEVKVMKFASKLHTRISLDGGYHVFDESMECSSDYRATYKGLWTPVIGVLELGIIGASGLVPMKSLKDGRKTSDAYCVAKYGPKWVRTSTVVESLSPKWNEQYTWEVYEPYTVIIIGVFDNCHLHREDMVGAPPSPKDPIIGKLRIRLSTLSTNRIYTYSYPLIALHPGGVRKMGEIQLALRFTCPSYTDLLKAYAQHLLPKMHYTHPLSVPQLDNLRQQASAVLSSWLSQAEPPLRKEVVECILDAGCHGQTRWSYRRGRANYNRLMAALNVFVEAWKWFGDIRKWNNLVASFLAIILFGIVVYSPSLILPTLLSYCFIIGIWQYRKRPRNPPCMDVKLSLADSTNADELDEEFDTVPSSRQGDVLRMRYDRLRNIAGQAMNMAADFATQGERVRSVLTWQDPRATSIFLGFCLLAAAILLFLPFKVILFFSKSQFILLAVGIYIIRLPLFVIDVPCVPENVFRRLPTKTDHLL
ncbi:hypothetical protein PTKIN_Ptkin13bG0230200 [Pterospermum kingtungense]